MLREKYATLLARVLCQLQKSRNLIEASRLYLGAAGMLIQDYAHPDGLHGVWQPNYVVKIVENPRAFLQRHGMELWMYFSPQGDHCMTGWYLYYTCAEGEYTQLWGPFADRKQAEIYSIAYYCTMQHRWIRCSG